jgi:hypothetical protein
MVSNQVPDKFNRILEAKTFAYFRVSKNASDNLVYVYELDHANQRIKFINLTTHQLGTCDLSRSKEFVITKDWSATYVHDEHLYVCLRDTIGGKTAMLSVENVWNGDKLIKFLQKNLKIFSANR